ncbi:MAG: hypothetical protein A2516_09340 [Alphaproteobacteria bacterium RIFOXYD12_FULL_60_8]|nr:MAG: hypothetical protein A2516_09340 [Alphaproteobacteria bacterium RIFOXYD12_FULL_60_8]
MTTPAERLMAFKSALAEAEAGRTQQALDSLSRILSQDPDHRPARSLRTKLLGEVGRSHLDAGEAARAEEVLREALRLTPDDPEILGNLALALARQDRGEEALAFSTRALLLGTGRDDLARNHADILLRGGKPEEAAALLRPMAGGNATLLLALGDALGAARSLEEAKDAYRAAIAADPTLCAPFEALAELLRIEGDVTQAAQVYDRARATRDGNAAVLRLKKALLLPPIPQDTAEIDRARTTLGETIDALSAENVLLPHPDKTVGRTAFHLAYHGLDDRPLQEKLARFYRSASPELTWTAPHVGKRRAPGRIRVVFVSRYLKHHTIGKLYGPLIARLDRTRFEVGVVQIGRPTDPMAQRIAASAEHALGVDDDLPRLREAIAALAPDIVVYPDIGMEPTTYFLAFSRLAPVQCVGCGHPDTTGIDTVDYFLSGQDLDREDGQELYSEKLIRLKGLSLCFEPPDIPDLLPRPELPDGRLYVCPQSLFKLHPDFDAVLADILRRDPLGRVLLIAQNRLEERLLARIGVAHPDVLSRLHVLPRMSEESFFGLIKAAHVLLDPLYFSGGNSTLEAFALGAPVVTLPRRHLRERVTLACYRKMGIEGWVAETPEGYVEMAVKVAKNGGEARAAILAAREPLFALEDEVRGYETFFENVMNSLS